MPVLLFRRSELTDNASAKASSGWHTCKTKTYCKYVCSFLPPQNPSKSPDPHIPNRQKKIRYPAIIGIVLAVLVALACLYCLFRFLSCCCCDCLSGGRYQRSSSSRRHKHKYADLHASSPYAGGYQPTANPGMMGPAYGGEPPPPRYAQFDSQHGGERRGGGGGGHDSLPKMPVWGEAETKRVHDLDRDDLDRDDDDDNNNTAEWRRKEKEMEFGYHEQKLPMLASEREREPAPGYHPSKKKEEEKEEVVGTSLPGGDLGQQPRAEMGGGHYKPYGAVYTPFTAGAWNAAQGGDGKGQKNWRDV
ncbi:MAG: hypothetical protein Q9219_002990 [cf. Caloplaca sp. 3 TL-2023]